jgi:hypothetical protein
MRWATIMILAGACATRPPAEPVRGVTPSSTPTPDITGHLLVEAGETGPKRADLLRYARQRPLVRVTGPSDLVVFDDGVAFLEEEGTVDGAYRRIPLTAHQLSALRKELAKDCPTLAGSLTYCTDSGDTAVTCHLDSAEKSGRETCEGRGDDAGRRVLAVADKIMKMSKAWIAGEPSRQDRYTRDDIEKTLSPVIWKRYVPVTGSGADVQPGVAADGAAPRR